MTGKQVNRVFPKLPKEILKQIAACQKQDNKQR